MEWLYQLKPKGGPRHTLSASRYESARHYLDRRARKLPENNPVDDDGKPIRLSLKDKMFKSLYAEKTIEGAPPKRAKRQMWIDKYQLYLDVLQHLDQR